MKTILDKDYNSHPGLSQSGAKEIIRSPLHFKAYLERDRDEQTPAQRIGSLVHLATLEPVKYDALICVAPECDRRTKDGKEIWASFQSSLRPGQEAITAKESELVTSVSIAAREALDKLCADLDAVIDSTEVPLEGTVNGTLIKGRLDAILLNEETGKRYVVDIKTTMDAGAESFAKDIANFKYYLQGAWYTTLAEAEGFYLIAVEKDAPNDWAIYTLDEAAHTKGLALMFSAIETFRQCNTFKQFPGYPKDIQTLALPKWVH
jgi:exodeoxyribonuclease VIII